MNRLPALLLSVVLLLLAGCGTEKPSEEAYLDVAAQAVRAAEEDARAHAAEGSATGPLLLNVRSFAGGAQRATGEVIPPERMQAAFERRLEQPFEPTPPDSSFNCLEMELGNSCWVPRNGVFVHLNIAHGTPGEIELVVTSTVTAGNYVPPVLCDRILRMEFVRRGEEWVLEEKTPTRTC